MPKENRKRGKKHKKSEKEEDVDAFYAAKAAQELQIQAAAEQQPQNDVGPSWMRSAESEFNPEAPFGYVDADVKAYFRTVDIQIRDWQDNGAQAEENEDVDPNEGAQMFITY